MDSVGLGDMNPVHRAQMRQQEEEADSVLVMFSRDMGANAPLVRYLQGSGFVSRWRAHVLGNDVTEKPRQLGFMLYR